MRMGLKVISAVFAKVAGLVLVAAGFLKGYDLLNSAAFPGLAWDQQTLQALQSASELAFGGWLIICRYSKPAKFFAVGCFSLFLTASLVKALSGAKSCGCFGPIDINPWIMAGFDSVALGLLLGWQPSPRLQVLGLTSCRVSYCANCLLLLLILGALASYRFLPNSFSRISGGAHDKGLLLFDPRHWYGRYLPLLDHTDAGQTLPHGLWVIMLRRPNCPHCQQVLGGFLQLASKGRNGVGDPRFCILDLSEHDGEKDMGSTGSNCLLAHLRGGTALAVQTPVFLVIEDGVLIRAETSIKIIENLFSPPTLW
jgi:hypothetical protein